MYKIGEGEKTCSVVEFVVPIIVLFGGSKKWCKK